MHYSAPLKIFLGAFMDVSNRPGASSLVGLCAFASIPFAAYCLKEKELVAAMFCCSAISMTAQAYFQPLFRNPLLPLIMGLGAGAAFQKWVLRDSSANVAKFSVINFATRAAIEGLLITTLSTYHLGLSALSIVALDLSVLTGALWITNKIVSAIREPEKHPHLA